VKHPFSQLFNVHGFSNVRQTEMYAVESLVPEFSAFELEMAMEKLKSLKSLGIDQILTELIKAGGNNFF